LGIKIKSITTKQYKEYKTTYHNKNYFKMKQTPLQRIKRVINFYYKRGVNSERINQLYFKILHKKV
jgi:hypothetical protein